MKEYEVQGNYSQGWESVYTADSMKEARDIVRDYRLNEPTIPFRIVAVRVSAKGWETNRSEVNA